MAKVSPALSFAVAETDFFSYTAKPATFKLLVRSLLNFHLVEETISAKNNTINTKNIK
jgi:hypothetical protein